VLEKNRPVSLELAAGQVRAEQVLFEFPSSVLRVETAGKAGFTIVNGSAAKVRVGLAVALFDPEGNLVGPGRAATRGDRWRRARKPSSPCSLLRDRADSSATSFQITLEAR